MFHVPTKTTNRLPVVMFVVGEIEMAFAIPLCVPACCTKVGKAVATGVTEFDGPEGGPVPTALVAVTVNV